MTAPASEYAYLCRVSDSPDASEIWRPVAGFPGYFVSNLGRVRSYRHSKGHSRLIGSVSPQGHLYVRLYGHQGRVSQHGRGPSIACYIHTLVLEAFVGPRPEGAVARHGKGGARDNRVSNLCWGTPAENVADAVNDGTATSHTVTPALALQIQRLRAFGMTHRALCEKYALSLMTVWRILRQGKTPLVASQATRFEKEDANEGASEGQCLSPLPAREGCSCRFAGPTGSASLGDDLRPQGNSRPSTGNGGGGDDVRERTRGLSASPQSIPVGSSPTPLVRVPSLIPSGYGYWGECSQCGANDWEKEEWEAGYRVTCRVCGRWICRHELRAVEHDSSGRWAGGKLTSAPPSGCPSLSEAICAASSSPTASDGDSNG